MSIPVFRRRRTVGEEHADVWGHVNNVVWIAFAIELAGDHSTAVGLDVEAYRRIGGHFVTHRHEIDYLAAAVPGDELVEETWIASFRGARSERRYRFVDAGNGRVLVRGKTFWVFVDRKSGRPTRIPAAVRERFSILAEDPA